MDSLVHKFSNIGEVTDIFCPSKWDKQGKLFGFMRFIKGSDEKRLLENLNNIWIGSYKLQASIPRYKREKVFQLEKSEFPSIIKEADNEVDHMNTRFENLTFTETVQSNKKITRFEESKVIDLNYASSDSDKEWTKKCYTGFLNRNFPWEDHVDELQGECGGQLSLKSIGGNLILLQSMSDKSTREVIEDFDEWVAFWFDWVRPWNNLDVNLNRSVWTRWFSIPLHAWSENFFALACAKFGLFIKMEDIKDQKYSLELARVLISTSSIQAIDKVMQVCIDGLTYNIRVVEEKYCSCSQPKVKFISSDDELESE